MKNNLRNIYHKTVPEKKRLELSCRRSIKKSIQLNPNLTSLTSSAYTKKVIIFWKERYGLKIKPYWHNAYTSINGIENVKYIPEDILFSTIIPKLNNMDLIKAYADKNVGKKIFKNINEPKVYLRNMHNKFYDENYKILEEKKSLIFLNKILRSL